MLPTEPTSAFLLKCDVALTAVITFYTLDTLYFNVYPPNTQIIHTVLTMVINSLALNCQKSECFVCRVIQVLGVIDLKKDFDFGKCSAVHLLESTLGSKDI